MPRIRSIKPDLWNDEKLGQESEAIMLTFIGTWNFADDYGVIKANAVWLKNQIYPYKEKLRIDVFTTWLKRLEELEVVIPVAFRGESFYYIRSFRKHQKIDRPSKARNIPEANLLALLKDKGLEFNSELDLIKCSTSIRRVFDEQSSTDKEEDRDRDRDRMGLDPTGLPEPAVPVTPPPDPGKQLQAEYKALPSKGKKEVFEFIRDKSPRFIDPYVDFWNHFAIERGKAKVQAITDSRRKKFQVRIREKGFSLIEILKCAKGSEFLLKGSWFSFDWLLENDSNYTKILEGNYDNEKVKQQTNESADEYAKRRQALETKTRNYGSG